MSNPTSNYSFQMPTSTDLVTDLPADFEVFGQAVDTRIKALNPETTLGDLAYGSATANTNTRLAIGTTGQVLTVAGGVPTWSTANPGDITGVTAGTGISGGGTSGDVTITNSMATEIDAKGDLIAGTGADTFSRLAIGTNNQVLTADSAAATGMKWATPSAGGGMTLLSTTSMAGSSTTTVSSINQTYKKLVLYVRDFYPSGSTAQMSMYFNGFNSSSNYFGTQWGARGSTAFNGQGLSNNSGFDLTAGFSNYLYNNNTDNFLVVTIEDYANTTTKKPVSWQINAPNDSATVVNAMGIGHSVNVGDSAISSISFNTNSGTWTNGSILVYGVS